MSNLLLLHNIIYAQLQKELVTAQTPKRNEIYTQAITWKQTQIFSKLPDSRIIRDWNNTQSQSIRRF